MKYYLMKANEPDKKGISKIIKKTELSEPEIRALMIALCCDSEDPDVKGNIGELYWVNGKPIYDKLGKVLK